MHDNKEGQSKMIFLVASETEEHVHLSRARGSSRVEVLLPEFQGWARTEQAGREGRRRDDVLLVALNAGIGPSRTVECWLGRSCLRHLRIVAD